jgi:hypothetical protein
LGWYSSVPKGKNQSRLEELRANSESQADAELPEFDSAFSPMLGFFFDMGQAMSTGMGLIPISWQEQRAWRLENKLSLTLWEIETLRKMSEAYCSEYHKATDPSRKRPFSLYNEDEIDEEAEKRKALALMNMLRSFRKK